MNKFIKAIKSPSYVFYYLVIKITNKYPAFLPDSIVIKALFYFEIGYKLNLKHPKTFNEKLQWLKLYQRDPIMTKMVDKYEAKQYVSDRVGEEYIIPTLGVWDSFDNIDFEKLPNQFVLKTTHDSGGVVIVRNKSMLDRKEAREILMKSMKHDFYQKFKEWPYKNVTHRIIAEKYMEDESGYELKDYKIFCFNGVPKLIQVDFGRFSKHKRNIYSTDWEYLGFSSLYPTDPNIKIRRPKKLDSMLNIAKKLSKGMPHVRIDLYLIYDQIYFGELTFYHESGFGKFKPEKWDTILGEWIKLPYFAR